MLEAFIILPYWLWLQAQRMALRCWLWLFMRGAWLFLRTVASTPEQRAMADEAFRPRRQAVEKPVTRERPKSEGSAH
jgi:hypothetical protein